MSHHHFGAALRRLRERTGPTMVGLPAGGRRRSPGLRREEVAELAGVSADYLRRLEQGRSHPSADVVNALARALGAGRADYERLCQLAGYAAADGRVPAEVGAGVVRLLERLGGAVVCFDAAWNAVACNGAWEALRCGEPTGHAFDGNVAWRTFGEVPGRVSRTMERAVAFEAMLATRLRTASLRYPADTVLAALVDELRCTSRRFDILWNTAGATAPQEDRAVLRHPEIGDVALDCDVLAAPDGDLRMLILTAAPGSGDAARLDEFFQTTGNPAAVKVGRSGPG
jgi:transcriptional regulator with XRE-family HTH domain